jgi:hypothetical protein
LKSHRSDSEEAFSNNGNAILRDITEGNLDGDLYYIWWDEVGVSLLLGCPLCVFFYLGSSFQAGLQGWYFSLEVLETISKSQLGVPSREFLIFAARV